MNIPLSKRLQVCAGFVAPGDRIADIGCDHGYLSIYLLKNGIAASAIASDINEMPLQSARRNASRFSVADKIRFFLSDGAKSIPREFDTMICAGMGADTMISILEAAQWLRDKKYRLILQCQSKTQELRRYLSENGWYIKNESVLKDGRFLYTVMNVVWDPALPRLTVGGWYFSPALLSDPGSEVPAYYQQVCFRLNRAINGQGDQADPTMIQALTELNCYPQWLKEENHDNC